VRWCARDGHDLTFIEVMPMGDIGNEMRLDQFWSCGPARAPADALSRSRPRRAHGGPARYVRLEETGQRVGFITPLTHNFCEGCNRVRVTCTGQIHTCLGRRGSSDLRAALRSSRRTTRSTTAIRAAIRLKPRGHDFDYSRGVGGRVGRAMSHTGG
jgi:cyclic pyranopterin phosphate synthase